MIRENIKAILLFLLSESIWGYYLQIPGGGIIIFCGTKSSVNGDKYTWNCGRNGTPNAGFISAEDRDFFRQYF
jgi:hypothetical protein